jgi:predicted nucleic acid-binding protein
VLRIVVSDSSCLIDLRKASLLDAFLQLPYEILIPDTLFDEELLQFTVPQKRSLIRGGLKVTELPGDGVARAQQIVRSLPRISVHDAFAFTLAERNPGCILLTGDAALRTFASSHRIEVHGVLWVIDEIHRTALLDVRVLHAALLLFDTDSAVRLPAAELASYIKRYAALV